MDIQNNAVAQTPQPNIAAMMGQVMQRKTQGVHRQPPSAKPASPSPATATPAVQVQKAQVPAPAVPPVPPPVQAQAPVPPVVSPPATVPPSASAPASGPTPPQDHGKYDNLPPSLRRDGRFCGWRYEERRSGKPAKVPRNLRTGQPANVANEADFVSFDEAIQRLTSAYDGIGVRIDSNICAIDIDDAIGTDGNPTPEAKDIISRMACYAEISPSGHGYRLLFTVRPDFVFDASTYYINNQQRHVEVYVAGATKKYVSITGNTISPGADLCDRTDQLRDVLDRYFRRPTPAPPPQAAVPPGSQPGQDLLPEDQQLLDAIRASASGELFDPLYAGDTSSYGGDHSRADLALCNILAARTADIAQIDRIFRHSGLMREKWDERRGSGTYGQMTVARALASAPRQDQQAVPDSPPVKDSQRPTPVSPPTPAIQPSQAIQQPGQQTTPASQQGQAGQRRGPIPARVLMQMILPVVKFFVAGLIAEGLTLLAAAPKSGKSFMALDLAISVATGTEFIGLSTTPSGVLYLALEDSPTRIKSRMTAILDGRPVPDELYLETEAPDMRHGLFDMLDDYMQQHPAIHLIIMDTLQLIRGNGTNPDTYSYSQDYQDLATLKKYADDHKLAVVLIHHTRKASDPDVFSQVSGTQGVAGAVDTTIVLSRQRNTDEAVLSVTGRDVEEREIAIRLDKQSLRWLNLGDAQARREQQEREKFYNDPLVKVITALTSTTGSWSGSSSELGSAGQKMGHDLGTAQQIGIKLANLSDKIGNYTGIVYTAKANGSGGKCHCFRADPTTSNTNIDSNANAG